MLNITEFMVYGVEKGRNDKIQVKKKGYQHNAAFLTTIKPTLV